MRVGGLTPEQIIDAVCAVTGLSVAVLKGPLRSRFISVPRQLCYFLLRDLGRLSSPKIAAVMGKDHTTVLYGIKEIERMLESNEQIRDWHAKILAKISERRAA